MSLWGAAYEAREASHPDGGRESCKVHDDFCCGYAFFQEKHARKRSFTEPEVTVWRINMLCSDHL
jgi:hypothetical protein